MEGRRIQGIHLKKGLLEAGLNRLENLRLLCPNCHSQTPNFAGRNGRGRRKEVIAQPPGP